MTDMKKSERK